MTDSAQEPDTDLDFELSPLRGVTMNLHEIHQELIYSGFDRKDATTIIAQMMTEILMSGRVDEYELDEDEDDNEDDEDI